MNQESLQVKASNLLNMTKSSPEPLMAILTVLTDVYQQAIEDAAQKMIDQAKRATGLGDAQTANWYTTQAREIRTMKSGGR